jgi:hypothetical protein
MMRLLTLVLVLSASIASAQPSTLPLIQAGDLTYLGSFTLPTSDGTNRPSNLGSLLYGGYGVSVRDNTLYYGCHGTGSDAFARLTLPPIGGVATILDPCVAVPNFAALDGTDGGERTLGGSLWWDARLIVSGYAFYDGDGDAVGSHFAGPSVAGLVGPVRVGPENPGLIGGYMGTVPSAWRAAFGGPALTGLCCISIITRSSFGPSVSVFDPAQIGQGGAVASTTLLKYTQSIPFPSDDWRVTAVGGVAFPSGTRSVLFVGRAGTTASCYGIGTSNPALHLTTDANGELLCYDPTAASKGYHGYPYTHRVWMFDANHLAEVKAGTRAPTSLVPTATWDLPQMMTEPGRADIRSAFYDDRTRRLYVVASAFSNTPRVHVYQVATVAPPPPPPPPASVTCAVTATVVLPVGTALTCSVAIPQD